MALSDIYIRSYSDSLTYVREGKERKIANNTTIRKAINGSVIVKYHQTDIITWHQDDTVTIDTDGWKTSTTKERINLMIPPGWCLYQEKGVWILRFGEHEHTFVDGIRIAASGRVSFPEGCQQMTPTDQKRLMKRIKKYARDYTKALLDGKVPAPSGADCWGCLMGMPSTDHYLMHFDEGYFVPSLLHNAMKKVNRLSAAAHSIIAELWGGKPQANLDILAKMGSNIREIAGPQIQACIEKFLRREFGLCDYVATSYRSKTYG
jgi:hypothetical protein